MPPRDRARRLRAVLGQLPQQLVGQRTGVVERLGSEEAARSSSGRALRVGDGDQPVGERGLELGHERRHRPRTRAGRPGVRAGSGSRRARVRRRQAAADRHAAERGDDVRLDVDDDVRDARAPRARAASGLPNAPRWNAIRRWPLRRDERRPDVRLAGAALVVVDDHVRRVAGRRPEGAHGARRLGIHADLEAARRAQDRAALAQHVGRAERPASRR